MLHFVCLAAAFALTSASDVIVLGDADFDSEMAKLDMALVKFYAPWCGHCKSLAPHFDTASAILKDDDPPVSLVKVDCTAEGKDICSQYDVKGFPTLKVFKNGELAFDYAGPRESDGIIKYMRSKAGPSSKDLNSVEAAEKFLSSADSGIAGFFTDSSSAAAKDYQKLADALTEDYRFGHSYDAAVLEKYGYKDEVVIFRPKRLANKFEDGEVKYEGDMSLSKLKSFVHDNIHGLVGHRTTGNQEQFKRPLVVAYFAVDYIKNTKGTNYWRNRVLKVAKKMSEAGKNVNFAIASNSDFGHEMSELGISVGADKPVVGARDASEQKFAMQQEFSVDNLEKFVNDLLDGKLEAYMKSEPIPEDNSAPVKTVVAKNFDDIVNDAEKDVLIEFYAPWCGHCKKLTPIYDELAEKLITDPSVTIAKMDATANDVPPAFKVQGFPTIFYAPKNNKSNPKKYEGAREVEDFLKFLAKESTDGLKEYKRSGKKGKQEL